MNFILSAFTLQAFICDSGNAFFTSDGIHKAGSKRTFSLPVNHLFRQNYLQSLGSPPPSTEPEEKPAPIDPVVAIDAIETEIEPVEGSNAYHFCGGVDAYLSGLSSSSWSASTSSNDLSSGTTSSEPPSPPPVEYAPDPAPVPVPVPEPQQSHSHSGDKYLDALSGTSWTGSTYTSDLSSSVTAPVPPPPPPVEVLPPVEPQTRSFSGGASYLDALSSFGGSGSGVQSYDHMVSYVDSISSEAKITSPVTEPEIPVNTLDSSVESPAPESISEPSSNGPSYQAFLDSMSEAGSATAPQQNGGMAAYLEAMTSWSSSVEKTMSADVTPPPAELTAPRSGMTSYLDALSSASSIGGTVASAVPSLKNSIDFDMTRMLNDMEVMLAEMEENVRKSEEMQRDFEARLAVLEQGAM